jgi:hypothetical protein
MVNGLPEITSVVFDDERVVANARVMLPALFEAITTQGKNLALTGAAD